MIFYLFIELSYVLHFISRALFISDEGHLKVPWLLCTFEGGLWIHA